MVQELIHWLVAKIHRLLKMLNTCRKKLFAALKVPKAYLGYDEDVGSKATLAQEDIRFSRSIAQESKKPLIAEFNKLAMIHLYAHGFEGEDLLDFSLSLVESFFT